MAEGEGFYFFSQSSPKCAQRRVNELHHRFSCVAASVRAEESASKQQQQQRLVVCVSIYLVNNSALYPKMHI